MGNLGGYDHLAAVRWFMGTQREQSARWYRAMATRLGLAALSAPTQSTASTLRFLSDTARLRCETMGGDPSWP